LCRWIAFALAAVPALGISEAARPALVLLALIACRPRDFDCLADGVLQIRAHAAKSFPSVDLEQYPPTQPGPRGKSRQPVRTARILAILVRWEIWLALEKSELCLDFDADNLTPTCQHIKVNTYHRRRVHFTRRHLHCCRASRKVYDSCRPTVQCCKLLYR
jgi:hypothetical protein